MNPRLTPEGYAVTKMKLANMEARLAALRTRSDLSAAHKREVEHSYIDMIRQYKRDITLYEMDHPETRADANGTPPGQPTSAREDLRQAE